MERNEPQEPTRRQSEYEGRKFTTIAEANQFYIRERMRLDTYLQAQTTMGGAEEVQASMHDLREWYDANVPNEDQVSYESELSRRSGLADELGRYGANADNLFNRYY